MASKPKQRSAATKRVRERQDGLATRQQLLQAAGEVFALHGYAKATSKEICARAGANVAAVNYHFGSKDELYATVLEEAHARLMSFEAVAAAVGSSAEPRDKLRALLRLLVSRIGSDETQSWELRVISRELMSQTPLLDRMLKNQVVPKAKLIKGMLAQIMRLPVDHPAVSRSAIHLIGPFVFLLLVGQRVRRVVLPELDLNPAQLGEHMATFVIAGLEAVAKRERAG